MRTLGRLRRFFLSIYTTTNYRSSGALAHVREGCIMMVDHRSALDVERTLEMIISAKRFTHQRSSVTGQRALPKMINIGRKRDPEI